MAFSSRFQTRIGDIGMIDGASNFIATPYEANLLLLTPLPRDIAGCTRGADYRSDRIERKLYLDETCFEFLFQDYLQIVRSLKMNRAYDFSMYNEENIAVCTNVICLN